MQYDDDIAFQRAILAAPSDTTLKLVYADWLQERDDPRADYIRLQLKIAQDDAARASAPALTFPMSPVQIARCWYGASDPRMYGFVCELGTERAVLRASDVLAAIKPADFRSEHIRRLSRTSIPFPGYHPGTDNDEIHTEFAEQYMFKND